MYVCGLRTEPLKLLQYLHRNILQLRGADAAPTALSISFPFWV